MIWRVVSHHAPFELRDLIASRETRPDRATRDRRREVPGLSRRGVDAAGHLLLASTGVPLTGSCG